MAIFNFQGIRIAGMATVMPSHEVRPDDFKEQFGDKVTFTDQERYTTKPGEMLADLHRRNVSSTDGFHRGADYVLAIDLLSKCNSFMASGRCAGVTEALKMNEDRFKEKFIFELGTVK